jgi:type I restriction enzyme M protein
MATGLTLVCPVRGRLKAMSESKDGLTPTEEKLRVEAIRHLIARGYPKENIRVEAVLKRFGNSGRNSFRADIVVLDSPVAAIRTRWMS